ncbi:hypothetical protein B0H15DRAFT_853717 [Mycena belliarum]|uniref:C2H2-type domain-containing protein n=1 Tax=Mycena belliarum TaxID=1033014 RepID=A0AAD6XIV4_9AGAR|nr:hypothetical protein B0H15DRAFT_853717 [Mycena belliae]
MTIRAIWGRKKGGSNPSFDGSHVLVTRPTPPANAQPPSNGYGWHGPAPGESSSSSALHNFSHTPPLMNYIPSAPRGNMLLHVPSQNMWSPIYGLDEAYSQYVPLYTGGAASPVFSHLPLIGSDSPQLQHRSFHDDYGIDTVPQSLLFGPGTPSRPPQDFQLPLDDRTPTTARKQSTRATPAAGFLTPLYHRHSSSGPAEECESSIVTADSPSSGFLTFAPTEIPLANPEVGSWATVQAARSRRKKPGKFACPYSGCISNFTARHNLRHHINSHKGVKPHQCHVCRTRFTTPSVLTRHLKLKKCPALAGSRPTAIPSS